MSQRRPAIGKQTVEKEKVTTIVEKESIPAQHEEGINLEERRDTGVDECTEIEPLSIVGDGRQSDSRQTRRIQVWKESTFAVGLTEPTWYDEKYRSSKLPSDESGCLCCSAYVCSFVGAGRVGNMAVLKSSMETVETILEYDEETGEPIIEKTQTPHLDIIVGPYWPMLFFVTYPLILGVSGFTFFVGIYKSSLHVLVVLFWAACTTGLIIALACTGFRDPGILRRTRHPPPSGSWRWTDAADTYRPRNAWYDTDTAVVVEGFDHTCPWTGTAIGKNNMLSFQIFVCLVFVCMLLDIFIMTGTIR